MSRAPSWARRTYPAGPRHPEARRHNSPLGLSICWVLAHCKLRTGRETFLPKRSSFLGATLAHRRPFFDDVGHLPARRRRRERNLCTLCWGKRAAGESSALQRRRLASPPFTLHEHGRGRLEHLLRQPRLRVADVRIRRRLRPAHAALAPAATGLQPTAPHRVNTSDTRGTPCPLHRPCHSHRNAS